MFSDAISNCSDMDNKHTVRIILFDRFKGSALLRKKEPEIQSFSQKQLPMKWNKMDIYGKIQIRVEESATLLDIFTNRRIFGV